MSQPSAITDQKSALRASALALRDAMPAVQRQAAAETIAARELPIEVMAGMIVAGFMPMKSEINPLPLLRKLAGQGAQLALPCIAGRGKPLIMRVWTIGDAFKEGQWGIREPLPEAPEVAPDIVIVPLAGFAQFQKFEKYTVPPVAAWSVTLRFSVIVAPL